MALGESQKRKIDKDIAFEKCVGILTSPNTTGFSAILKKK